MKIGDQLYGFRVESVRDLPEMQARLWRMTHEKSGADLAFLDRADENSVVCAVGSLYSVGEIRACFERY